mgnify:CR=1 FL=1
MARRSRESTARMHTTAPLQVEVLNPLEDHPGLTPLEHKKIRRIARKVKGGGKAKVKVKVDVVAQTGGKDD